MTNKFLLKMVVLIIMATSMNVSAQQWAKLTSGTSNSLLGVYTVDNDISYVCGGSGTILKTTNGGTTWTSLSSGIGNDLYATWFTSSTVGYAIGSGGAALKTTNGGSSWSAMSVSGSYDYRNVYFISSTTGFIVGGTSGTTGIIYKTTDGGSTWTSSTVASTIIYSIAFYTSNDGIATDFNGNVFTTSNGGSSWSAASAVSLSSLFGSTFFSSSTGIATGNNGTIVKTTNGGSSWTSISSGVSDYFTDVEFISSTTRGYIVGGDVSANTGRILYTTDGGDNWTSCTLPGSTNRLYRVSFYNYTGYAVGLNGTILKYVDCLNEPIWNKLTTGVSNSILGVSVVDVNTIYVSGSGGLIMKTTNGGSTWTTQTSGITQTLYSINFIDANTGYAVGDAGVNLKTSNGGSTWSSMSISTAANLREVKFSGSTGYICGGVSTSSGSVYKTTDGGTTWTALSTGAGNMIYSTVFTTSSIGYASGSDGFVYNTTDGGTNWASVTTGVAGNPGKLFFTSSTDGVLVNNGGVIRNTTNSGTSWGAVTSGTSSVLTGIDNREGALIYAVGGDVSANTATMIKSSNNTTWSAVSTVPSGTNRLYNIEYYSYNGYSVGLNGTVIKSYVCQGFVPRPAGTTAIDNLTNYKTFLAYPNPTNGSSTIDLNQHLFTNEANFELFDMSGRSVQKANAIDEDKFTFETSNLSPGVYFFKIYDAQTIVGNGKLVVQ